ncbi:MAG: right-handed parallel beta-helix repeat-containing protein, partial [Ignavibacteriae bacterium]|nr:right-handed parallel beta-helix repeat-containing protein [Ignavibacteriota bacterium]
ITFDREGESGFWNGIYCYNSSSFYMNGAEIKNANNGIYISHGTPDIDIINSNFDSNYYSDIYLEQMTFGEGSPAVISYNKFNDLLTHLYGIGCNEINNVDINNNQFDDVFNIGIFLEHSSNFKVLSNRIYAPLINGPSAMTGIYCYQSDGFLSCNEITNFLDGILFDNSSPYLLNNEIYNNGYGLYLTNSSNPILSPSYSQSQSLYNAGYNKIYNCEGPEIFCDNNFGFPISLPYLYNGQNSIYDSSNQVLISTNLSYYDDPLQAQQNFWGQVPTSQMFYPDYSVVYSDYLSREPTYTNCSPELISENNDSLNQNILLLGSSNINYYTKNYSSAISGYKQIINSYSSNLLNSLVSSKLYYTYLRANSSFPELASYYSTVANQHSSDTAFYKHTRNLMIGSHVKMPLYQQAIDEYQNIINNSQNQNEIYYATLEKLRTIELMLDSLLNPGGYNSEYNNYPTHELSNLVKNFLLNNYSAINQNDRNRSENNKSENSREIRKDNNVKTSNNDVKKENIKRKEENKKQVAISNIKSDSKINKQNYINNLKKSISIDNLNLSKLKNSELLSLLDKIITIKLIEKSLLNFTPENRPLYRMKSNKNKGIHKNEGLNNLPKEFKLYQNYPNPFNPVTKINYDLPKDGKVKLVIYDILGREIKILVNNEFKQAGQYLIEFNGNFLASGIYFYRIQIEG